LFYFEAIGIFYESTMLINPNVRGVLAGIVLLIGVAGKAAAQNPCSYQVISTGNYQMPVLAAALDNAKLDAYRFKTQRRTLVFDQNAQVELLSSLELSVNGCPVDALKAMPDQTPIAPNRSFTISASGVLVEVIGPRIKQ
jgi:hypothetical protein